MDKTDDQTLAKEISEVSPLDFETALLALETPRTRQQALDILFSAKQNEEAMKRISKARQKLRNVL